MKVQYKIINVAELTGKSKTGKSYQYLEIDYKEDGKAATYKMYPFGADFDKNLYLQCLNLEPGTAYEIDKEKDENGYWKWKSVEQAAAVPEEAAPAGRVADSDRQVLIVRQSSLGHSVSYHAKFSDSCSPEDVVATAKLFESFVHTGALPAAPKPRKTGTEALVDMPDDLEDIPL